MAVLSKPLAFGLATVAVLNGVNASPLPESFNITERAATSFEWTAFGDSYSSGVGAGDYISNSYRCLRYTQAYPSQTDHDGRLPAGEHVFHNAVCSGSKTSDVEAYQFFEKDEWGKPNAQYGDRPRFGTPSMGTLSVGGNDIDFPGIIFNCILDTNLPFSGVRRRPCAEQRVATWNLLLDPTMVDKIDGTIKKIIDRARQGPIGEKFKLYVTGFPQFFSTETDECDTVTFARTANPNPDGNDHPMMTQELRKEFNLMSVQLNKNIAAAVDRNKGRGASWIPIDDMMDGHRYCEKGIKEPDQHNKNLWLLHYPYNEPKDDVLDAQLQDAYNRLPIQLKTASNDSLFVDYQNALYDNLQFSGNPNARGAQDPIWRSLGNRVKLFHPHPALHEKIRDKVLDAYVADTTSTQPAPKDETKCHGIGGDYWVMSRDTAVENVKAFCGQRAKELVYNKDTVNELRLSIKNLRDSNKVPTDAPDCVGRFTRAVIDGCDGADQINNPFNYKFGGKLTSGDGWEYKMEPLSKQVNEVRCDYSYRFFYDAVEIRGKNLPDARLGPTGGGLLDNLRHCGSVTDWKFERTPDDVKFQWYAYAQLPLGTKSCIGSAIKDAGGSSDGGCSGPGKRSSGELHGMEDRPGYEPESKHVLKDLGLAERDSIDDWPGYGPDSKHVFKISGPSKRDSIESWPGYGPDSKHVFKDSGLAERDSIDNWPGYGPDSKHVFKDAGSSS